MASAYPIGDGQADRLDTRGHHARIAASVWGTKDAFFFLEMPFGEFRQITARVRVLGNVDPWTKAGVMIRETLSAGSRHADAIVSPSKGMATAPVPAEPAPRPTSGAGAAPILLRIRRSETPQVIGIAVTGHKPGVEPRPSSTTFA